MKTLNIYKNTTLALMALTMGLSLVGCAEDSELIYQGAQQLSVKPLILDNKVSRATTASDASLNEDKLYNFNIKMFGEYNKCKVDKTFTTDLQSGKEEVIAQNNWKVKNDLQEGNTYSVKSVANANATVSGDVQTDVDIWKPYDATSNSNKMFLMSSIQDYEVTKEPTQTIQVNLARAAAKIVLTVHVDVEGYTAGLAKWQLKNYNAKTTIFGRNTESELKDGEMVEAQGESGEYTVTTYSYATQWTDDTKAPAIYLEVPLTADGKTEMNYYKIPVRDPKATGEDAKKLNRNTIYTIDAKINNKGGSSEIGYVTTGKVVYDVLPWSEGGTTDIDANTSYLMVYPQSLIMKNIAKDNTSISYKSSTELEITIDEVYYYNKNGKKTIINEGYTEKDDNGKDVQLYPKVTLSTDENGKYQGKINIESAVPINLTAKYIVFSVKTKDGKDSKQVIVKQYPLKYVQNIAGWYSTKDNWVDWESDRNVRGPYSQPQGKKKYEDSWMTSRVYGTFSGSTGIWDIYDTEEKKRVSGFFNPVYEYTYQAKVHNCNTEQDNNHMYVIQITKSDGTYKIARPRFNNLKSDDHTVSPAFMLASQLGVVKRFQTFEDAANHCDAYVEVSMNKKRYDDWRLPTQEEINSIVEFQNDKKAANTMDRVLIGRYYWTANGGRSNEVPGWSSDNTPGAVRCIRDLSPAEVQELENNLK
ncbi:MAG: DUF1566 domain-containing protein [Prevotella sp.]|nr:DUF1566 domain-containing protein [Prevotella sp.]